MKRTDVLSLLLAGVLLGWGISSADATPTLLTWSAFTNASDLSGLTQNLENGNPASIFGGVGSGLAWAGGNSFVMSPDRGPNAVVWNTNVDNTTSYISRLQNVTLDLTRSGSGSFTLTPTLNSTTLLYSTTPLAYNYYGYGATSTVVGGNYYFNGRSDNFTNGTSANPNNARLDPEAVRVSPDGRYVYLSDEYGPYVYQFDRETGMRTKIFDLASNLSVTNQSSRASVEIASNTIGRVANKGMEGLAISPDGSTLFGFIQGPLIQDGGNGASYNRIVKINVTNGEIAQYAYNNQVGGTNPSSEILAINNNEFLVLERDSKGLGESNAAVVKDLIKIDLSGATDVTGLSGSVALALNAVTGTVFLDIVAAMNAYGISSSNIPAKLESIAWGQDMVINGTNTHMLYMANDNDFVTNTSGPSVVYVFAVTDADLGGSTFVNQSISFQLGGDLYIGSNSTVPPVSYTSGTNFYNNVYVGYDAPASNNQLLVANAGTILTNSAAFYVGYSGSGNSLTISNGGRVIVSGSANWLAIGENSGANSNSVTVTGSNSSLNVDGWLEVGWGTNSGNRMVIADGGSVSDSKGFIGYTNGSYGNSAMISGMNSTWTNAESFYVGYSGASNSLIISNGGKVFDQNGSIGYHGDGNTALITGTNSLWSNSAGFYVGNCGSYAQLIVSNGGGVISSNGYIAEVSKWSNCSAVITGNGSYWSNSGTLTIGSVANGGNNPSSGNSLIISDGGVVTDTIATIAATTNFYSNSITVTGSNSLWSNSGDLYLGYAGSSNALIISNGATVADYNGLIGFGNTASNNSVLVTGHGSTWTNTGYLIVGESGSGNSLVISNGGAVVATNGGIYIGDAPDSSNNSVTISGANSKMTGSELGVGAGGAGANRNKLSVLGGAVVSGLYQIEIGWVNSTGNQVLVSGAGSTLDSSLGTIYVGGAGGSNDVGNSLVISNGGQVLAFDCDVGAWQNTFSNSIIVTGTNSTLHCSSTLMIGFLGNNNSLTISNGGGVTSVGLSIGQGEDDLYVPGQGIVAHYPQNSNNSVVVTRANSSLTNTGDFYVGYYGSSNSLMISNGGHVINQGNAYLGYTHTIIHSPTYFASNNSVVVTGVGSLWTNSGSLSVGYAGSGNSMLISNGGKVYNADGYIGHEATAVGNLVTVTGSNSSWINSGDLYVGFAGKSNRLVILDGGYVSNVNGFDDGISPTDAFNSVLVTGAGSRWQNSANLTFGLGGHDNSLVVSNGGVVTVGSNSIIGDLSTATNNSVLVTGSNSLLSHSGTITIGNLGSGTLTWPTGACLSHHRS